MTDPRIETVVLKFSSQVGKTECLLNALGYHIDRDPAAMLVLLPTLTMAEDWSTDRLTPMLRDSPSLAGRVAPSRSRDGANTILHKSFRGGHVTLAGANSPASLSSRPIRILICDEVDRYPASAGKEGDPLALAIKRTSTFWNRKVVLASSPLLEGTSRIDAAYSASDMRRFWIPCPQCGHMQTLKWAQVRWDDDDPETALYHCSGCGVGWSDQERWRAVNHPDAEWRAEGRFGPVAGFHLSELYSPWRKLAQTVEDFRKAKGKPQLLQVFANTSLGETWQERGDAPEWERLLERAEDFQMGVVPRGALVLTAAVDNQAAPERLEVAVWAWAPGYESWLVDTRVIPGSPAAAEPWDEVAKIMAQAWPCEDGGTLTIAKWAADTGGQHTAGVYAQLRRLRDPRCVPIKGVAGWRSSITTGPVDIDLDRRGQKIKRGLKLWSVSVDVLKSELYRRLWLTRTGDTFPAGWVHLPQALDPEEFQQLVAEQLITVKSRNGYARQEWQKMRANEQLDLAVYARAALSVLGSDRYGDGFWARVGGPVGTPAPTDAGETPRTPATNISPPPQVYATRQGRPLRRVISRSSMMD